MSDEVTRGDKPFNRLTGLCAVMTQALELALEAEIGEQSPVRCVVFIEDDKGAGIEYVNYPETSEAIASMLTHITVMLRSAGIDMRIVGMPPGMEN